MSPDGEQRQARSVLLRELAGSGKLVSAGTIGGTAPRDVVLLKAADEAEVRALLGRDPAVQRGDVRHEIHLWTPAELAPSAIADGAAAAP